MPFDRMVAAVDNWAGARARKDVFAQIGETSLRPRHIEWTPLLDPDVFRAKVQAASILVAHAGMGSILTALEAGKPILVMPRRGDLRETRNDHQIATARRFLELNKVAVAFDESELGPKLDHLDRLSASERISPWASDRLVRTLADFIAAPRRTAAAPARTGAPAPASVP